MIIINAKIKVDENKREDYLQLMADLVEHSRQEKGNLFYHHYEDCLLYTSPSPRD